MKHSNKRVIVAFVIFLFSLSLVGVLLQSATNHPTTTPTGRTSEASSRSTTSEATSASTLSETSPTITGTGFSPVVIGATHPAGYVMGDIIDFSLQVGMTSVNIEKPQDQMSIRFTAQKSGVASALVINGYAPQGSPRLMLGLQQDRNGIPSGTWLGGTANRGEVSIPPQSKKFVQATLPDPVPLSQGSVYHLVLTPAEGMSGVAAITVYPVDVKYQPLNFSDPDINWKDDAINTLRYQNGTWVVQNEYPVFIIRLSDASAMGQPYSLTAGWVILNKTFVGQRIMPASTYNLGKIAFVVTKQGNPMDNLYYEILDASNTVLSSGVFASPSDVPVLFWTWREITLPQSVLIQAGRLYRVMLYSPNSDIQNCYQLIGHEVTFDPAIGYGGFQQQLEYSPDAGRTWSDWTDADAIFRLTTV